MSPNSSVCCLTCRVIKDCHGHNDIPFWTKWFYCRGCFLQVGKGSWTQTLVFLVSVRESDLCLIVVLLQTIMANCLFYPIFWKIYQFSQFQVDYFLWPLLRMNQRRYVWRVLQVGGAGLKLSFGIWGVYMCDMWRQEVQAEPRAKVLGLSSFILVWKRCVCKRTFLSD